jgi:hypothetical protein
MTHGGSGLMLEDGVPLIFGVVVATVFRSHFRCGGEGARGARL